jgi:hypothetical protein
MTHSTDANAFFDAISNANHERVQSLLRAAPELARAFDRRCFGATPLGYAAGMGDREMIDILLAAGADPDGRSDWYFWGGAGVYRLGGC